MKAGREGRSPQTAAYVYLHVVAARSLMTTKTHIGGVIQQSPESTANLQLLKTWTESRSTSLPYCRLLPTTYLRVYDLQHICFITPL